MFPNTKKKGWTECFRAVSRYGTLSLIFLISSDCSMLSDHNGADSDIKRCLSLSCDFSLHIGWRIKSMKYFSGLQASRKPSVLWREHRFFAIVTSSSLQLLFFCWMACGFCLCVSIICIILFWHFFFNLFQSLKLFWFVFYSLLLHQHLNPAALPQEESEKTRDFISGAVTVC